MDSVSSLISFSGKKQRTVRSFEPVCLPCASYCTIILSQGLVQLNSAPFTLGKIRLAHVADDSHLWASNLRTKKGNSLKKTEPFPGAVVPHVLHIQTRSKQCPRQRVFEWSVIIRVMASFNYIKCKHVHFRFLNSVHHRAKATNECSVFHRFDRLIANTLPALLDCVRQTMYLCCHCSYWLTFCVSIQMDHWYQSSGLISFL